ncbi:hypothetical protein V2J09_021671 [Rumex salicifolius]
MTKLKIASWNTRGLNDPAKHYVVRHLVKITKVDIIALLETRLKHNKEVGIWLWWNPSKIISCPLLVTDQIFHCRLSN